MAFGKQFPEQGPLTADSFSGGEATVVPALTRLGFRIISHRRRLVRRRGPGHGRRLFRHAACRGGWGAVQQVRAQPALRQLLNGRSKSSVELKHQNISAVLDALGLPYINGYKPRGNSQCCCVNPYTPTFWNISRRSALLSMPWRR
ncbi:Hypothetical protein WLH_05703 (plasmid) [Escherichia coli O25b:H4]|uniref:Uncharacterized protein n=1 Tax=Escherichia coli O25b:H4 TaxID=941280 RepID=A0A192CN87_ECO25|nr:Hypothetical protein WLH_05703 [Escherichia coli O25b:H4]